MKINDKVYNVIKWVTMIFLPALSSLYFGLAQIWGLPYAEQIVGTIAVVETFLGVLIGITSANYTGHGTLEIDQTKLSKDTYRLNVDVPLEDLKTKKTVMFKVDPNAKLGD